MMKKKQILALILSTLFAILACTACGSEDDSGREMPEWVYVPEFMNLDDVENISWYDVQLEGDSLCYISSDWDMETGESTYTLNQYLLADRTVSQTPLTLPENTYMNEWTLGGPDRELYGILSGGYLDELTQEYTRYWYLARFDSQGNQVFLQDISGLQEGDYIYFSSIAADAQGRIYLAGDNAVWLFDSEGKAAGEAGFGGGMGSYVNDLFCGQDGNVYASISTYGDNGMATSLYAANFEAKKMEEKYTDFPTGRGSGSLAQGTDGKYIINNGLAVTQYDPETQTQEKLFSWLDSNINGDTVRNFGVMSDGRIAVVYQDWTNADNGLALLSRTKSDELPEKERIVIAVMSADQELQAAAVRFNKSSDKYQVTVKEYYDYFSEMTYADAMTNLNNDISSRNCPDLILLSAYGVDADQLAAKGVFEDLAPYLEKSVVLNRDNMVESALNAYTYDGKLIAIPDSFSLGTIFGSKATVGDRMGWSLDDMIAFSGANPGKELFDRVSKTTMLSYCLMYNMNTFVDWSAGKCNFDSPEFKSLLEFVTRFPDPDQISYDEGQADTPTRIQRGEVLLLEADLYDMDTIQLYVEMFRGDVTPIGFPNTDNSSGCVLSANGCYAITSKSKVKDGAWAFIESFLSRENTNYRWGFPNNREELDAMAEEATRIYELDENGDIFLDEDGNPVERQVHHTYGWGDFRYEYRISTQEEVDMIYDLIDAARPASGTNQQIMSIITEETESFFQGQKTVDEVTPVIQSRVQVYVDENS